MPAPPVLPTKEEIISRTLQQFNKRPCYLQIKICQAILEQTKNIVCMAATGFGKTLTFFMPLLFNQEGIIIIVTALNILGQQNVSQLQSIGISAIAVNGDTCNVELAMVRCIHATNYS